LVTVDSKEEEEKSYQERDGAPKYHHVLRVCGFCFWVVGGRGRSVGCLEKHHEEDCETPHLEGISILNANEFPGNY
jgi:hypothetical protein